MEKAFKYFKFFKNRLCSQGRHFNKIVKNKLLEIHPQAQIHFLKNVDEKISSTTIKGFITLGGTFDENSYLTLSTNAPLSGHLQYLNKNVYTYILKNKIYL